MGSVPILVTGATGANGSELVRQLSAAGVPVRAMVHNRAKAASIEGPGVEIVEGDFTKPETLDAALQGAEKAFLVPPFEPRHVELTGNFIEAARRAGTKHIVKLSALGTAPDASFTIGRWHAQSEQQLEASGIEYTHLRPNGFMQNIFAVAPLISGQGVFYQPAEDAKVSQVDIRDIAAVAVKALTEDGHAGKAYDITGPEALSFHEVAEKLSTVRGKPVSYVSVSPEDFKKSMLGWGQPEWLIDSLNELFAYYRAGQGATVTNVVAEVAKKQPISFDQFARDYAQVFKG
jgi:uncharacterized protein YbjT (DUF2867 family)